MDELKKLQKKWYAKLAKEGFKDIERPDGMLDGYVNSKRNNPRVLDQEAVQEYYLQATHILTNWPYEAEPDLRNVWELHASGMGIYELAAKLRISYPKVKRIITQIEDDHKLVRRVKK